MLAQKIEKYKPYNEQEKKDKELILEYINNFDNLFTRENEFAHFTASNWILNKDKTKVLMVYHNIYKTWAWTGGHADGEKDLQKVALREAKEETGLKNIKFLDNEIFAIQALAVTGHKKHGKYVSSHLHLDCCFLLEADENEITKIKEDENSGVRWVNINEVESLTSELQMIPIYNKLNQKLKELYI